MAQHRNSSSGRRGGWLGRLLHLPQRENYVVGVIGDPDRVQAALEALRRESFARDDIVLQDPGEVEERIREESAEVPTAALTEEGSYCVDYNEMAAGSTILSVYARTPEEVKRAHRVLAAHGAHEIRYFGDWTITDLPAAGRG